MPLFPPSCSLFAGLSRPYELHAHASIARLVLGLVVMGVTSSPAPVPGQALVVETAPKFIPAGPGKRSFNATRHIIPLDQITSGGVSRDQIPALTHPRFVNAREAGAELTDSDRVLGVYLDGHAKAYPVRILNYHELVNDVIGRRPVLVSW